VLKIRIIYKSWFAGAFWAINILMCFGKLEGLCVKNK